MVNLDKRKHARNLSKLTDPDVSFMHNDSLLEDTKHSTHVVPSSMNKTSVTNHQQDDSTGYARILKQK